MATLFFHRHIGSDMFDPTSRSTALTQTILGHFTKSGLVRENQTLEKLVIHSAQLGHDRVVQLEEQLARREWLAIVGRQLDCREQLLVPFPAHIPDRNPMTREDNFLWPPGIVPANVDLVLTYLFEVCHIVFLGGEEKPPPTGEQAHRK
jgi:hypothetical protein